jgi:hypothetical protein
VCERCMQYRKKESALAAHLERCPTAHPPGRLVYSDAEQERSVWAVSGDREKDYSINLCLLCKLFLQDKSLCNNPAGCVSRAVWRSTA